MIQRNDTPLALVGAAQSPPMSDHLVRVGHLKAIQRANGWDDSELGRQCGRTPQQVYSWFSGTRKIGETLARALEQKLGLARYALDERPATPGPHGVNSDRSAGKGLSPPVTTRSKEVPVIAWTDIQTMLNVENATLKQKAPHLETFAVCSSRAKFLQMPDDSMAAEIAPGDHLLFDPVEAPHAGDIVLVSVPSGEVFVRVFRPRTAHVFEAAPNNEAYQAITSADDQAVVMGVLVEHRRYRRTARPA